MDSFDCRVIKTVRLLRQRTEEFDSDSTRTNTPYNSMVLMRPDILEMTEKHTIDIDDLYQRI